MGDRRQQLAHAVAALDVAVRCGAIVIAAALIGEWHNESIPSNSDGFPVNLLTGPLVVVILWNLAIAGTSIRRWINGTLDHDGHITRVGALSAARLLWLQPLADDIWYRHRTPLQALMTASVACTALAVAQRSRPKHDPLAARDEAPSSTS